MARILKPAALALLFALAVAAPASAQRVELIEPGETWRYFKGRTEASTPIDAWRAPGFPDAAWLEGPTGIGYGDGDDATLLADMEGSYVTIYARKSFTVVDPSAYTALYLDLDYDDGFIAYLNGVEVARAEMPPGAPAFDTRATSHEAGPPERFDLGAFLPLLVPGSNLLAIEIHNDSSGSSDASLIPRLFAEGRNPVLRGPYLQSQTPTSVVVLWRTANPSIGEVAFGIGATDQLVTESAATTDHVVTLTGLVPGELYRYHVGESGMALSADASFRSARQAGDNRFRVVVFGDSGVATIPQWNVARLIESLAPDLVLHTGDVIYDAGQAAYYDERFFEPYRRSVQRCAFWPTLGNHDWRTAGGQPFVDAFHLPPSGDPSTDEHWYSFRYADTLFLALDSDPRPVPGSPQYLWLEDQLRTAGDCFKVAYFHHPPYNSGAGHGSELEIRASLTPLFDRYRVDLVFNGHEHNYERSLPLNSTLVVSAAQEPDYVNPGGTIYVVTGGGGNSLYATGFDYWTAVNSSRFHVVVLDRDGDTWTLRAVEADGSPLGLEFDRATLRKTSCGGAPFTIYRSPNKHDIPLNPLTSTTARSWSDPLPPAPALFHYQVEPAGLLWMVRDANLANLSW